MLEAPCAPNKTDHRRGWAQPFNVLRYESGQHYDSHYDIFEPESYGPQPSQRVHHAHAILPHAL